MLVQVDAMLDKTICALSNVIIRLHLHGGHLPAAKGLGFSVPLRRVYLCQGELPNYIAEQD